MRNTAKIIGKSDIRTFTKAVNTKTVDAILEVLDIRDDASHERAVTIVGDLMDWVGDHPEHPLYRLIHILADAIERYEMKQSPMPATTPIGTLKFLMTQNRLTQAQLGKILGSQSIVSDLLSGKRELNLRQVRKLADYFHVEPAVFV